MLTHKDYFDEESFVGVATLKDYRFEMLRFANVVSSSGDRVIGCLWDIDEGKLNELDQIEGYPDLYDRILVDVSTKGKPESAFVYVMTSNTRTVLKHTHPSKKYIQTIRQGYDNAGIPMSQLVNAMSYQK
jgi:gamma-glutamylcyclotransferase (GGCT)/AIG2-like uncharacterized protein YtfP